MITIQAGNLLTADAEALVNTVNTEGVMGKGIALQFARAFPEILKPYEAACRSGELRVGTVQVIERNGLLNPRYIINFPTKRHWRGKSRMADIEIGLLALVRELRERGIRSVAVPPLGCGLGGLNWQDVLPRIEQALAAMPEVEVMLFPPAGTPIAAEQPNRTARPALTPARARVIEVLAAYLGLGYELSLLEVQKLLYFLQLAGDDLKLVYAKHTYGPYADNLRHVLKRFEGHYTRGHSDGAEAPDTEIVLLPGAHEEALEFLAEARAHEAEDHRLGRVVQLIEGFESPYGLELLATVHWVAANDGASTLDQAVAQVHAWNDSKRQRMSREHIALAWNRLDMLGWLVVESAQATEAPLIATSESAAQPPVSARVDDHPAAAAAPLGRYENLSHQQLVGLLRRRDAERQLGLVWERDELDADNAINDDFVTLSLDPGLSHGAAPWRNLIIEGDNFDALRALRLSHAGRIRCIYIDPPYNTGNRDFVYNDRFIDKTHRFRHSLWLEFMHRRLRLARDLLTPDGVIFVSIDDNELFRLGMLMDQVFGETNKLACFAWQTDGNFDNQAKIKICHEYILAYSPRAHLFPKPKVADPNVSSESKIFRAEIKNTIVKNGPKNPISELRLPAGFPASFEAGRVKAQSHKWPHIDQDFGVEDWKTTNETVLRSGWANRELCQAFIAASFRAVEDSKGQSTRFAVLPSGAVENIKVRDDVSHVISVLRNLGNTQSDSSMLGEMGIDFTYPKPVSMMQYLLSTVDDPNGIFLDFFAGSGTTAHAVAKLNAEDGGTRKFILVSSTEATAEQPDKNLCRDVCAKRVRRVLGGFSNAKGEAIAGLGGGFAYLRARRIPPHRLATRIEHAEVWHALQLMHGLPLSHWTDGSFQSDAAAGQAVAYLADFAEPSLAALKAWLAATAHATTTIYCWKPERVQALAPDAHWSPIPESLRIRFGR